MTKGLKTRGYTIVEAMIVLAVTGALIIMVMRTVSGQRERAEFRQAINDIQTQINDVINNVATGYYNNTGNVHCVAGPGGPVLSSFNQEQGTNEGCIFLGQAIQFQVDSDKNAYKIYDIAGLRRDSGGNAVENLNEALPKAIANPPAGVDTSQSKTLQYGLEAARMYYRHGADAPIDISAVAFTSSFASYSGGDLTSGSHRVELQPVQNTAGIGSSAVAAAINKDNLGLIPDGGVVICFNGGSQHGIITIGGNARQLTTDLVIGQGACS